MGSSAHAVTPQPPLPATRLKFIRYIIEHKKHLLEPISDPQAEAVCGQLLATLCPTTRKST
jgi:hypothetical protein